jgi:multisubunit Na+/H+ antiporter MnhC subunit
MNVAGIPIFNAVGIAAVLLLAAGLYSLLVTTNLIRALIALELAIKAVTLFLILAGRAAGRADLAQSLVITLIVIEVVIMVVAGGLVLGVFRGTRSIDSRRIRNLKG